MVVEPAADPKEQIEEGEEPMCDEDVVAGDLVGHTTERIVHQLSA